MTEAGALLFALQPFIPITVLAAVGLFLMKEGLEWAKRRRVDKRKLSAIKRIVSRDLEVNGWVVKCYRGALGALERLDSEPSREMVFLRPASGRLHYEHWDVEDQPDPIKSGGMYPSPVTANLEKYLLDAATLDRRLLSHIEAASSALAELEHIRTSTIEQLDDPHHRSSYVGYAERVLNNVDVELTKLYRYCTGKDKIDVRIR